MYVSSIPVMCYYNGHIVRTDNDVKYDGNKASIVPLEIPLDCTFEQLGDIIFSNKPIDKRKFIYKKNPDLQRKFCNGQIYCKIVTNLQQNANESLISKLQLDCN